MPPAVETHALCFTFSGKPVLAGLGLNVPAGSVYGFLGRNGSGKSTTIRLLLGLLRPDSGEVRVGGLSVSKFRQQTARKVGALLDPSGLYPNLSGLDHLRMQSRMLGLPASESDRVLELVDMTHAARDRVSAFSLGMRQRLGIARALLGSPEMLVLDEPCNGLDPEGIADMRVFLKSLPDRTGATVLLSSHLLGEIEQTATHVGILHDGKLAVQAPIETLKKQVSAETRFDTAAPEQALAVARQHGFKVHASGNAITATFQAHEDTSEASAHLNHLLCREGIRVHGIQALQTGLEALYKHATQPTESRA